MTTLTRPDIEISVPANAENVAVVRHVLGGLGDALDIEPEVLHDLRLAVSEACANVIVHAYRDRDGLLDLTATANVDRTIEVVVRDRGRGMGPRADSPGLGVGLPLIAALTASLEIGTSETGATEVRMLFALDPSAETPVAG
ncbi:ATP-binding protein [Paraconexibacter sp.]|uniref:ATP-binding protein n=1 Tax=Paraconexibacter sp. TaxID=2949640 RepID=UPI00356366FA